MHHTEGTSSAGRILPPVDRIRRRTGSQPNSRTRSEHTSKLRMKRVGRYLCDWVGRADIACWISTNILRDNRAWEEPPKTLLAAERFEHGGQELTWEPPIMYTPTIRQNIPADNVRPRRIRECFADAPGANIVSRNVLTYCGGVHNRWFPCQLLAAVLETFGGQKRLRRLLPRAVVAQDIRGDPASYICTPDPIAQIAAHALHSEF